MARCQIIAPKSRRREKKNCFDLLVFIFVFPFLLQIGSLKNYYLFHHNHISKRSVRDSEEHHNALNAEPEVSEFYYGIGASQPRTQWTGHFV